MLSKAASRTIFWVFGMIRPGIEPQSPGPLVNTLLIRPMARLLVGRVLANCPGNLGSILCQVMPKTLKMVLDTSLLDTSQRYKVCIKGKVEQSRERSSALPTPRCCSYWKGNLRVTLDNGRQLIYIYIYRDAVFTLSRFFPYYICFPGNSMFCS